MNRFKVINTRKSQDGKSTPCKIFIDEKEVSGVVEYSIRNNVDSLTEVILKMYVESTEIIND